jgi:hypothetical protein
MHLFKSRNPQHLEISFEFYTAEKSDYRKPEPKKASSHELGFRSIPFQSKYPLQLNYMQRPKKQSLVRSLLHI